MTLGDVLFRTIQMDPGLERFAFEFASIVSEAVGSGVVVSYVFALSSGHAQVEFRVLAPDGSPAGDATFSEVLSELVGQLEHADRALRRSDFGRHYFRSVELYQVTEEGTVSVCREPRSMVSPQPVGPSMSTSVIGRCVCSVLRPHFS